MKQRSNGFVHCEAVANECAAQFYSSRGFAKISHVYWRGARNCYLRWGADGKVCQLDELHPHLKEQKPAPSPSGTMETSVENLDLATVIKVSQAVSGEHDLQKLIDILMRTAIEHAGAQRGLLILPAGGQLNVEAEATTTGNAISVRLRTADGTADELPDSIAHYVARTHENVILEDASSQGGFSRDAYIVRHQVRSVLCLPLLKQANLIGVLYLENNLAKGVFTPVRVAVLRMLASEAAMSLENTRLYEELKERESKVRRLVESNIIGICIYHIDRRVIEANDAFLNIVGYSRDDVISGCLSFAGLTPSEWAEADEQHMAELVSTGTWRPSEKEFFRKDGSRVPVLVGGAIFGGLGQQGVAFVVDLTERKRSEEALRRAQADLAHVSRITTLGEMTTSIAHEVNQPLGSVVNNANACLAILTKSSPNLGEVRQALQEIIEGADRATAVISRVRNLSKKVPYESALVDLNHIITEVMSLVRHEAATRQVHTQIKTDGNLPPVRADRVQLQQVLLNLVANGMEAMTTIEASRRAIVISAWWEFRGKEPWCLMSVRAQRQRARDRFRYERESAVRVAPR
jgi:PAS domain S-box-containing protein